MTSKGFTLVEILVVIGIILIVTAILVPIISTSKSKALDTSCLSNIRQVTVASNLYSSDYDDIFPLVLQKPIDRGEPTSDWYNWRIGVTPYIKESLVCPIAVRDKTIPDNYRWGYCLNYFTHRSQVINGVTSYTPKSTNAVTDPSKTVLVAECNPFGIIMAWPDNDKMSLVPFAATDLLNVYRHHPPASLRHHGGANYVFTDGSAKWLKPDQVGGEDKPFSFFIAKD